MEREKEHDENNSINDQIDHSPHADNCNVNQTSSTNDVDSDRQAFGQIRMYQVVGPNTESNQLQKVA